MIRIFGDVHAHFPIFWSLLKEVPEEYHIVQVGDFGIWPSSKNALEQGPPRKVLFIDGNHEYFPYLNGISEPREIYPNTVYVPRGTVMELDGRTVLFLGGGESPDKEWRTHGVDWFPEESITYADLQKIPEDVEHVDLMITHVPPETVVHQVTGGNADPQWNVSARAVEVVWESFGRPRLVCGHMHFRKTVGSVEIIPELGYIDV